MKPLLTIPSYVRDGRDVELLIDTIKSIRSTENDAVDVLVVDDGSPEEGQDLLTAIEGLTERYEFELERKPTNDGFSVTVNVGLKRSLEEGRDAILVNADVEFMHPGWLNQMLTTPRMQGEDDQLASVVGGLLCYPNGLIQHGGVYLSLLTRTFDHLYKYAPMNLPEAQVPRPCPVTAAVQFIRHECLTNVGLYDEEYKMGWEDVDYCIRTFLSDRTCVYNPLVRAWHHESVFRGRPTPKIAEWQQISYTRLMTKWQGQSFAGLVPQL